MALARRCCDLACDHRWWAEPFAKLTHLISLLNFLFSVLVNRFCDSFIWILTAATYYLPIPPPIFICPHKFLSPVQVYLFCLLTHQVQLGLTMTMGLELTDGAWWAQQWSYNRRQWFPPFQNLLLASSPEAKGGASLAPHLSILTVDRAYPSVSIYVIVSWWLWWPLET